MKTAHKLLIELILLFCAYNFEASEETFIKDFLICRACGSDVAVTNFLLHKLSPQARYAANETLFEDQKALVQELENPFGIRYRIILLKHATCANVDSWSTDFSWFPGYAWKLCLCTKCGTHLGWMFEPTETATSTQVLPTQDGFYAIILPNVITESFVNSLLMREKILREN
uniref:Putative conserved secreted protein n=2 Tax=Nyssomyia neivai TaxID=330878 RepID=A0A1L8DP13_9DIPT